MPKFKLFTSKASTEGFHDTSSGVSPATFPAHESRTSAPEHSNRSASLSSEGASMASSSSSPTYFYYRVYAEDGAVPTANPVYSDDPYIGRISAQLVAPPPIAKNIKQRICVVENIDVPTTLFLTASSQTSMEEGARNSFLVYPGPGCTEDIPLALLARLPTTRRPSNVEARERAPQGSTPFEARYIHYQVFDKKLNPLLLRQPPNPNNPYVGRISVDIIPPPHTAASIKRCVSRVEGLHFSNQSQLYPSVSSIIPIDQGHIPILTSECPGSTSDHPIAIVDTSSMLPSLQIDTRPPLPRRGGGVAPSPCRSLMRPSP